MQISVTDSERDGAKTPHEVFILNLFAFHLLATPLILFSGIGVWGLALPPLLSGGVITYIFLRGRQAERNAPWFIMLHWKIAFARCKLLLMAYGVSAVLLVLAWLLSLGAGKTQDIMFTVLTRVAVMPTVIMVFVTAVLESGAIYQATRGEVPDNLAARYPQPTV